MPVWPGAGRAQGPAPVEHELKLIAELRYEPYFLTVEDIVRYARIQEILCQGQGSAANSAVCY
jgi:error-prone DNA polymerase